MSLATHTTPAIVVQLPTGAARCRIRCEPAGTAGVVLQLVRADGARHGTKQALISATEHAAICRRHSIVGAFQLLDKLDLNAAPMGVDTTP